MKNYMVQASVNIQGEETKENFDLVLRNVWMNQFIFLEEYSLKVIELNEDASFRRFTEQGSDVWFLKAGDAYVKVVVSSREVIISPMKLQKLFDLSFYTKVMLCLCEDMLIWNFSAQEISAGEIEC